MYCLKFRCLLFDSFKENSLLVSNRARKLKRFLNEIFIFLKVLMMFQSLLIGVQMIDDCVRYKNVLILSCGKKKVKNVTFQNVLRADAESMNQA